MKYCVVVTNRSKARFFSLEPSEIPELESGPNLVEHAQVEDPELHEKGHNLWSERSGKNRSSTSGASHGYDDHRAQHEAEFERRFVQSVAERGARLAKRIGATEVLVVGNQRQVPALSGTLVNLLSGCARVEAYSKDLAKLAPHALHDHLSKEGLLPKRRGTV